MNLGPTPEDQRWLIPGPRVIRDAKQLRGFSSVSLRELRQLYTGNALLAFSIMAIVELILIDG